MNTSCLIGVDTGGTFTDVVALSGGRLRSYKLSSTPGRFEAAVLEGSGVLSEGAAFSLLHSTTVATNALLERKGARTGLITSAGFGDVLEIGRQNRPHLYDLFPRKPEGLVPAGLRFEVPERVGADGRVITPLDLGGLPEIVGALRAEGVVSVAVLFLFSFLYPEHERALGARLEAEGFSVSLSHEVLPEFREAVQTLLSGPAAGVAGAVAVARAGGHALNLITFDMGGTSTDVALIRGEPVLSTRHCPGGIPVAVPMVDVHTVGAGGGSVASVDAGGALRALPEGCWRAEDGIENGEGTGVEAWIRAELRLKGGEAVVDFGESDGAVRGSLNAVRAITESAVYYAFLCWMCRERPWDPPPVNAGCFVPVSVRTRAGTVVDAGCPRAVAGGNVETSQRIVDVVFALLGQAAPGAFPAQSQGTMNNVTFGGVDALGRGFAYYETLAGGSGAGRGHPGADAVQCHMTNTLNTTVEALEYAYPLRVREVSVRRGSGGVGAFRGGDGMVREWEALVPMEVTLLTERRFLAPAGAAGGGAGRTGCQVLRRAGSGEAEGLPAKGTRHLEAGDRVRVETPGGGGYGGA